MTPLTEAIWFLGLKLNASKVEETTTSGEHFGEVANRNPPKGNLSRILHTEPETLK